jgi:hypothetical protein
MFLFLPDDADDVRDNDSGKYFFLHNYETSKSDYSKLLSILESEHVYRYVFCLFTVFI